MVKSIKITRNIGCQKIFTGEKKIVLSIIKKAMLCYIIGPIFFDENLTGNKYLHLLKNELIPALVAL